MHCSRLVWNRTAEIKFGLRPNFGETKVSDPKFGLRLYLRPKLSVTLLFALIRSQTGCLVSDQGLKLWFQRKIKWPTVRLTRYSNYIRRQLRDLNGKFRRWRTASIFKMVILLYLTRESSDFGEIWWADAPVTWEILQFYDSFIYPKVMPLTFHTQNALWAWSWRYEIQKSNNNKTALI